MRLSLEGLEFVGDGGEARYTIEAVHGLDLGGVDVRREQDNRPAAHGAFTFPGYLTGRSVRWSGLVLTSSPAEQDHALARLSGMLAAGRVGRLSVDGERSMWLDVQRASPEPPEILVPGRIARYRIELWAADPRMYGAVHEVGAGVEAFHYGNFPARPDLVVSGTAASGYTVTGPNGRQVVVTKALAAGAPHTISFAQGGLYIDGVRQIRAITKFQPWEVGPGLPGAIATVNNGVTLKQRTTDTWV